MAPDLAKIVNFKVRDALQGKFTFTSSRNLVAIFISISCRMGLRIGPIVSYKPELWPLILPKLPISRFRDALEGKFTIGSSRNLVGVFISISCRMGLCIGRIGSYAPELQPLIWLKLSISRFRDALEGMFTMGSSRNLVGIVISSCQMGLHIGPIGSYMHQSSAPDLAEIANFKVL
jgi:hypothetical protein